MDMTQDPPAAETPPEEVSRRAAQFVPQIEAGKHAVMLEAMRRQARNYDARTMDGHKLGQRIVNAALGGVSDEPDEQQADDMGDMIIAGDITQHYHMPTSPPTQQWPVSPVAEIVKDKPAVVEAAKEVGGGAMRMFGPAILAAALAGPLGGLAGWWMAGRDKPTVATPAEAGARVRIFWGETELQPDKPLTTTVTEESKKTP